jgi:hypothetical protein
MQGWGQGTVEHCVLLRGRARMYLFSVSETVGDTSLGRLGP